MPRPVLVASRPQQTTYGGRTILLAPVTPGVEELTAMLRGPVAPPLARPKVEIVDRPGTVGLTQWRGRDPYEMTLPIWWDAFPDGTVEADVRRLERLALRAPGSDESALIQVYGPVPAPTGVKSPLWRIKTLGEVPERTMFNTAGERCRFAVDVTLIEHVADELLTETLDASRSGGGRGITNRRTTVRAGETSLYDVARRVYGGDGSRASDIARANSLRLAAHLKQGMSLRLP
jgi:hypothetical protein